jgi:hypothetical protein
MRLLALYAVLLVATAAPAAAQSHPPGHAGSRPHGPDHVRPSGHHHGMHDRLHGQWHGTLGSEKGTASALELAVMGDSLQKVSLSMKAERAMQLGAATDVVFSGNGVRWTQRRSGAVCTATAVLSTLSPNTQDTLTGKLVCGHEELPFTLRKRTA